MPQIKSPHRFKNFTSSPLRLVGTLVVILIISALAYHFTHRTPKSKQIVTVGTPVASSVKKSSGTGDTPQKKPVSNPTGGLGGGGATDTHGQTEPQTNSAQWTTSASGLITVKQPIADSKLASGDALSGSASVSQIHYRLSDNQVGVIAQGTLNVVNNNFSGILHFAPRGSGGRLDIFSTDAHGVEYNEVQINVSF